MGKDPEKRIMLERVKDSGSGIPERVRIAEASFPAPFPRSLEYNAPAHGTWNIVHIGMTVPQSHSIYVCADNCLRGVVMTAAEMGCRDRFSSVMIRERDIQTDNLETITIEGVSDVIRHLPEQPPVVFVFLVCMHIFVGSDEDYMIRKLADRWPGIRFVRGYMDCIRQKEGPTPDMKLRMAEYEPIDPLPLSAGRVNVLGQDVPFRPDCELISLLTSRGYDVRQLQDCGNGIGDFGDIGKQNIRPHVDKDSCPKGKHEEKGLDEGGAHDHQDDKNRSLGSHAGFHRGQDF